MLDARAGVGHLQIQTAVRGSAGAGRLGHPPQLITAVQSIDAAVLQLCVFCDLVAAAGFDVCAHSMSVCLSLAGVMAFARRTALN